MRVGDRVMITSGFGRGVVGRVASIDERVRWPAPCPCCGMGVSVQPDGNISATYGVAPADLIGLSPGVAFPAPGPRPSGGLTP